MGKIVFQVSFNFSILFQITSSTICWTRFSSHLHKGESKKCHHSKNLFSHHACKLSHHQADGYIRHKHVEGFSLLVKVWKIHFLFETKHTLGGNWGLQGIPYYLGQLQLSQFLDINDQLKNYIKKIYIIVSAFSLNLKVSQSNLYKIIYDQVIKNIGNKQNNSM